MNRVSTVLFLAGIAALPAFGGSNDARQEVKKQAQVAVEAYTKGDYAKFVDLLHPKMAKMAGGRDKLIAVLTKFDKEMKSKGFEVESVVVEDTSALVITDSKAFAIVPYTVKLRFAGGKGVQKTFMVGFSEDKGKNWTFLEGGKLDQEKVKRFEPDFPAQLRIPKVQPPVFEKDKLDPPAVGGNNEIRQEAKKQAQIVIQAFVKRDYVKFADLMHPKLIQLIGSREKLIDALKKIDEELKSSGVEVESVSLGDTSDLVMANSKAFAIVPYTLTMKFRGGKIRQKTFVLGISSDKGKNWTFLGGVKLDQVRLKLLDLGIPAQLRLPERQKPVIEEDNENR